MLIEVLDDRKGAILTIAGQFRVLIGLDVEESVHQCNLWLVNDITWNMNLDTGKVQLSGCQIACTYFHSVFLPDGLREIIHVFKSFNEPMDLPYGWKVYPVSSGTTVSNWHFTHLDGSSLLICGDTSIQTNCVFRNRFECPPVDALIHLPLMRPQASKDVRHLKSLLRDCASPTLVLAVPDVFSAVAVAVQAACLIDPDETVRIVSSEDWVKILPSLFEWLSEDFQLHLRKCVKVTCDLNEEFSMFASCRNVHVGESIIPSEKVVIRIDSSSLDLFPIVEISTTEELEIFYSAAMILTSGSFDIDNRESIPVECFSSRDAMVQALQYAFPHARFDPSTEELVVPSLETTVKLDADGNPSEMTTTGLRDIGSLVHILI